MAVTKVTAIKTTAIPFRESATGQTPYNVVLFSFSLRLDHYWHPTEEMLSNV